MTPQKPLNGGRWYSKVPDGINKGIATSKSGG